MNNDEYTYVITIFISTTLATNIDTIIRSIERLLLYNIYKIILAREAIYISNLVFKLVHFLQILSFEILY